MTLRRTYRYLHLDVFTNRPLTGNQLAVFLDPEGLDTDTMQRIALEMSFSETTFVFPPEQAGTDHRVRIFTPRVELPMAGHPTIGTTFALVYTGRIAKASRLVTLGLGIGPTPVGLEWRADELHFAWMTQQLPQFGRPLDRHQGFATALGLNEADIRDTKLPVQIVSCGLPFLYVPLFSRDAVNRAELDRGAFLRVCHAAEIDEHGVFLFTLQKEDSDDATVFSRMLAPGFGIPEDPATGSASGPLGAYLVQHGALNPEAARHIVSRQGVRMGRPSEIHISVGVKNEQITDVRVGGQAVVVGEDTLTL
jgi:trans-2,3-dihydro-3-hydroxyanthranilate isomerase